MKFDSAQFSSLAHITLPSSVLGVVGLYGWYVSWGLDVVEACGSGKVGIMGFRGLGSD